MGKKQNGYKKLKQQKGGRGRVTERPPTQADDDFKTGKTAWQRAQHEFGVVQLSPCQLLFLSLSLSLCLFL